MFVIDGFTSMYPSYDRGLNPGSTPSGGGPITRVAVMFAYAGAQAKDAKFHQEAQELATLIAAGKPADLSVSSTTHTCTRRD